MVWQGRRENSASAYGEDTIEGAAVCGAKQKERQEIEEQGDGME
jgi:hypothetical protein